MSPGECDENFEYTSNSVPREARLLDCDPGDITSSSLGTTYIPSSWSDTPDVHNLVSDNRSIDFADSLGDGTRKRKRIPRIPGGFPCHALGCEMVFDRQYNLSQHHRRAHTGVSGRNFECTDCHARFLYRKDLYRHVRSVHENSSPYRCPHCPQESRRRDNLNRHIIQRHGGKDVTLEASRSLKSNAINRTVHHRSHSENVQRPEQQALEQSVDHLLNNDINLYPGSLFFVQEATRSRQASNENLALLEESSLIRSLGNDDLPPPTLASCRRDVLTDRRRVSTAHHHPNVVSTNGLEYPRSSDAVITIGTRSARSEAETSAEDVIDREEHGGSLRNHVVALNHAIDPHLNSLPPRYQYKALMSHRKAEVRLVTICTDEQDGKMRCEISHHRLEDPDLKYIALSYAWGEDGEDHEIMIDGEFSLPVRPNLYQAMKQMKQSGPQTLWVDAICINQNDLTEKTAQIQLLPAIFSNALRVTIWLGQHYDGSEKAYSLLQKKSNLLDYDAIEQSTESTSVWHACLQLFNRPWFSRIWVMQEIAFAKHAEVCCGNSSMNWVDFENAIGIIKDKIGRLSNRGLSSHGQQGRILDHQAITDVGCSSAIFFVETKGDLYRMNSSGGIAELRYSLKDLMSRLYPLKCSDPRDRIYACLSLAKDAAGVQATFDLKWPVLPVTSLDTSLLDSRELDLLKARDVAIRPNCELSVVEVYKALILFAVASSKTLDLLCYPWGQGNTLPSWVPEYSSRPFEWLKLAESSTRLVRTRINADPLIDSAYNACASLPAIPDRDVGFLDDDGVENHHMFVNGFILDSLDRVLDASMHGNVPSEWLQLVAELDSSSPIPDILWRTLVADRGRGGQNAPLYYKQACERAAQEKLYGINTVALKATKCPIMQEFLQRLESVVTNRRLFLSKTSRHLGLCPKGSMNGDVVVIVKGLSVPLVLRPVLAPANKTHYRWIGECYVHGMMDGEAVFERRRKAEQGMESTVNARELLMRRMFERFIIE